MKRFSFALVIVLACSLTAAPARAEANAPPNVLFISIDDLNDWLGCYGGHPQVKTPHIDALATRGVTFTNAHCQAPICNPSRVSMLLGKLPSTTGMYFLAPNFRDVDGTKNEETIFQTFRKSGYHLSTMGKIFHGKVDDLSFDHVERDRGWRKGKDKIRFTLPGSHPSWDWGQVDVPDEEQRDHRTAAWAAEEIPQLAKGDKPFFLAVGFHLPHVPIYASKKWFDLYPLDDIELPETLATDRIDLPEYAKQLTLNPTGPRHQWMVENDEWRHAVQAYLAANSFVDHLVGMLLDSLENSDAADNTVVVLWSDHGFHLGEKLRWAKRTLWEETTRVPLIIAGPEQLAISTDAECARPVGLIDVYPTLLDLCGLPEKADLEGISLRPLLKDPATEWTRPALCTFGRNNHSLRSDDWRYTIYDDGSEELYDHRNDPNEWKNLAADPAELTNEQLRVIAELKKSMPTVNVPALPGSAGSDSPLYDEGGKEPLHKRMKRAKDKK